MSTSILEVTSSLRTRAKQTKPAFSTSQIIAMTFPDVLVTGYELPQQIDEAVARMTKGPVLLYRRGISTAEQRVAIAHGLAHLIYDDNAPCVRGRAGSPHRERRADAFAAELLVPLDELVRVLRVLPSKDPDEQQLYLDHVDYLASLFQAPSQLIRKRIRELVVSSH
jgi:Zn-dependent peptidase ImmA (M78 family)